MINLENFNLLEGYNQLIKGYTITKKKFMISCFDGVCTQIKFSFGGKAKKGWEPLL